MLEGGVIKQLLDEKWKTYARVSISYSNIITLSRANGAFILNPWQECG